MKKYLVAILISILSLNLYASPDKLSGQDYKIIMSSQDMRAEKNEKMDINKITKEEMLSCGVASSYVDKITEFKEIVGGFEKIEDLKKIKGIGQATYEKLSKKFEVKTPAEKKMLNINSVDEKILKYYGFSKKEIKDIIKYLDKYDRITNNIELKKIISKKTYEKLKDRIVY